MADARKSLRAVFDEAQELDGEQRRAYLDQACGCDAALRNEVEELLQSAEAAGGFLADPARDAPTSISPLPQREGDRIGRYKLLQKIGEGGCGVVYVAEQTEPVKRRVALKVIKLGLETHSVIARFEAERQALAMMDHPSIARILDAGTTETGRPYFVMELVRGIKVTDYCEQNQLTTRQRLDLFIKVCHAVQHAHQKGIIHRDLKPSNILVTSDDGVPLPKVIDFGIAKATSEIQLTDRTLFTRFDMFIGTPAYMSPEQAEFNASDIDTRSDIYALGVLLYELLTGQTPFDARELLKDGLDAMQRTIREKEPLRPSTRLSQTLGTADPRRRSEPSDDVAGSEADEGASSRRALRIKETITLLRGDLDWIVLKALEKDRTRRYETANGLAADIQRHLANEPVLARPPSTAYRVRKAWQRNQLAFTAAAAVAVALIAGAALSTWQAFEATRARSEETHQRLAAQKAESLALARQKDAEQARAFAETARTGESAQRQLAESRAYAADMNLAQQALAADNLELAADLLDQHEPRPDQPDRRGWEWRFLRQQSQSDALYTLCAQKDRIIGLSVSPDRKWVAVRTVQGAVSVWNLATRREAMRASGSWNAVAFSPTQPRLAMWQTGSPGASPWLTWWNADSGTYATEPPSPNDSGSWWKAGLTFAPDGQSVVASTLNTLTVCRVSDGSELASHAIDMDGRGVGFPLAIAQHTNWVAVGESGRRLRVIDLTGGNEIFRATTSGSWIETVALSGDGQILASSSGTDETVVHLWNVASGRELGLLEGHRGFVSALVFWPDGRTLASAGADKTIRIWDVGTRRPLRVLRGQKGEIHRLALLPDNSTLISGARDGSVMVWTDVKIPRRQATVLSWKAGPHQMVPGAQHYDWAAFWSLSSDGNVILTLDPDGWLRRRHGRDFQETETLFRVDADPLEVRFSRDQRWLATRTGAGEVRVWDVSRRKLQHELTVDAGPVSLGGFLTGTNLLAIWDTNALTLAIHDVVSGKPGGSWSYAHRGTGFVKIANDGQWCLTAGEGQTGVVRQLSDGRGVGSVPLADSLAGTFSPDGKQLAICYRSGLVRRWELPSLAEREPLRGFSSALGGFSSANHRTMTFSPDGRRLAVGSASYAMRLWDVESGRPLLTFSGETDHSLSLGVAFSGDGSTLAVLHALGTFDIWRAPSWKEIDDAGSRAKAGNRQP